MRLVYTSDLHGILDLYRAAGEAALARCADALIFGGDLCPGTPSTSAVHLPQSQPQFLLEELGPLLGAWKRANPALRVFAIPGNDDCQTVLEVLEALEASGVIENLHRKSASLGPYKLLGLSYVPPTPFSIKDFERNELSRNSEYEPQFARSVLGTKEGFKVIEDFKAYLDAHPTIEEELERLPMSDAAHTIAVVHCPPYQTRCDVLYDGRSIGSHDVRRWIERRQPLLTLHGHIHESPKLSGSFFDRVGATLVVNPGCDGRRSHLVFIDLERLDELEHSVYGRAKTSGD